MTPKTMERIEVPPKAVALRLLSAGFQYPDIKGRDRFASLLAEARRVDAVPAAGLSALEAAYSRESAAELEAAHFRLFGPAAACTQSLAFHLTKEPYGQAQKLADLAGFYAAFGVEAEGRSDELPVVLEFLSYLELKKAHAATNGWDDKRRVTEEASAALRGELVRKALEAFTVKLRECGAPEFYLQLAALCRSNLGGAS